MEVRGRLLLYGRVLYVFCNAKYLRFGKTITMDFHQKQAAYLELKGEQYLEADRILLATLRPASKILKGLKNPDRVQVQEKILWELLDVASPDQIQENRGAESRKNLFGQISKTPVIPDGEDKKKSPGSTSPANQGKGTSSKGNRVSKH